MAHSILVCAPAWLGDLMMVQPLLDILYQRGHSIDLLAPPWNAMIAQRMPQIRRVYTLPLQHGSLQLKMRYQCAQGLKVHGYQQAIICQNSWKSALIPWWMGIKQRTGYLGEMRLGLINDMYRVSSKHRLMVQRYMAFAFAQGQPLPHYTLPRLMVDKDEQAASCLQFALDTQRPVLALCPGAAFGSTKQWPSQYYADVALTWLNKGWQVWIFGSERDKTQANSIMQWTQARCCDLTGRLTLTQTVDLLALARVSVCNDSGLLHVSAALDVPLVAIYGATTPDHTPPLSKKAIVLSTHLHCQPCKQALCRYQHRQCLWQVYPHLVNTALKQIVM